MLPLHPHDTKRRTLTPRIQACREFVNRNVVCKSASTKSPELLAKYADSLLRKSAKSAEEADLENKLTQIVRLYSRLVFLQTLIY